MKVRIIWAGVVLAIAALVLASVAAEVMRTTAECPQHANASPGTVGAGPVSITTDHSVYAPGDTIQATITNHLSTSIIINNDSYTSLCPYFALELRVGNDWQYIPECSSIGGDAAPPGNDQKQIAAGASFSSMVGISPYVRLPSSRGTYRLQTAPYRIVAPIKGRVTDPSTAESATFQICACGVCA